MDRTTHNRPSDPFFAHRATSAAGKAITGYARVQRYARPTISSPPTAQQWVTWKVEMQNGPHGPVFHEFLTRREGFEPSVMLPPRLISSQVHSTTLPPLRIVESAIVAGFLGPHEKFMLKFTRPSVPSRPCRGAALREWSRCRPGSDNFPAPPPGSGPRPGPSRSGCAPARFCPWHS